MLCLGCWRSKPTSFHTRSCCWNCRSSMVLNTAAARHLSLENFRAFQLHYKLCSHCANCITTPTSRSLEHRGGRHFYWSDSCASESHKECCVATGTPITCHKTWEVQPVRWRKRSVPPPPRSHRQGKMTAQWAAWPGTSGAVLWYWWSMQPVQLPGRTSPPGWLSVPPHV